MTQPNRQTVVFEEAFSKPVHVIFDSEATSSDGGILLLRQLDEGIGLSKALVAGLTDQRAQEKVDFSYLELFRQRCYGIAAGYTDANDAGRLVNDGAFRMAVDRDPIHGKGLASQPTLSRFENAIPAQEVVRLGRLFETTVIERVAKNHGKAKKITIDLDSTVDVAHGRQEGIFFNGFYDDWCYLPLVAFVSVDDDPEQFLFHARLRPGNSNNCRGVIPLLRRTIAQIRRQLPRARILVRADAGFFQPQLLSALEELGVAYAIGMPKNPKLTRIAEPVMEVIRKHTKDQGCSQKLFGEIAYQAKSWSSERRVICKTEVLWYEGRPMRDNQRFVVTSGIRLSPNNTYDWYCKRGDTENRIKELKLDLDLDRTSCSRFTANQTRVLIAATAYALFQELRRRLASTKAARFTVGRLRDTFIKVAAHLQASVRRLVCHLPAHHPWGDLWRQAAIACGGRC